MYNIGVPFTLIAASLSGPSAVEDWVVFTKDENWEVRYDKANIVDVGESPNLKRQVSISMRQYGGMAGGEEHRGNYRFEIDCEAGVILILEIAIRFVDGRQEEVPVPEYNVNTLSQTRRASPVIFVRLKYRCVNASPDREPLTPVFGGQSRSQKDIYAN